MRGWRKWSVAMLALLMGYSLALLGKLTSDFATIAAVAVGAYNVANAVVAYGRSNDGAGDSDHTYPPL